MNAQTVTVTGVDDNDIDGHKDYQVSLSSEILNVLSAGASWVDSTSESSIEHLFNGVSYGNGIFVSVGGEGKIYTSSDGSSWSSQDIVSDLSGMEGLNGGSYGNGTFVAVGDLSLIHIGRSRRRGEGRSRLFILRH